MLRGVRGDGGSESAERSRRGSLALSSSTPLASTQVNAPTLHTDVRSAYVRVTRLRSARLDEVRRGRLQQARRGMATYNVTRFTRQLLKRYRKGQSTHSRVVHSSRTPLISSSTTEPPSLVLHLYPTHFRFEQQVRHTLHPNVCVELMRFVAAWELQLRQSHEVLPRGDSRASAAHNSPRRARRSGCPILRRYVLSPPSAHRC